MQARDALLRRMPDVTMLAERLGGKGTLELLADLDLSRVMEKNEIEKGLTGAVAAPSANVCYPR